ncbi:MAG: hypothetical protein AAFV07_20155 [Bacteroidota bacterium]
MRAILLMLPFLLTTCTGTGEEARRSKAAARVMMGKATAQEWELVRWFDPYNGGYTVPADSVYPRYLIFFADGGFIQYQGANYSDGQWLLSEDGQRMALVYAIQNGQRLTQARKDTTFRYQVISRGEDTLKLGIRGRHGVVEYTYAPARKSVLPVPAEKP